MITRRRFLGAAAAAPVVLPSATGLRWLPAGDDDVLIVIELAGGNDGLATLIPVDDERLARLRPTLSGVRGGAIAVADGFALHPSMREVAELFERSECCAVHGVGYEPPDRSHFRSRDVWYTADPTLGAVVGATTGWLGRAADLLAARGAAVPALAIGALDVPLALRGTRVVAPALHRLEDYRLVVDAPGAERGPRREALGRLVRDSGGTSTAASSAADGGLAAYLGTVAESALDSEARLARALSRYTPRAEFPEGSLGEHLQLVSRVVVSGFGTRLFHVALSGFDTHARQAPAHAGLLRQMSRALGALIADLRAHGALERVAVLVYSEFGRRVAENRSQGTDHGAAAPVLVIGSGVRGCLHGTPPDVDDLVDGDVRPTTDFRRVYATLLERIGVPSIDVLGAGIEPLALF